MLAGWPRRCEARALAGLGGARQRAERRAAALRGAQIEEPELEADEADGEDDRENWGASASEEESEEEEEDSDDEDFAAEFLKEKVGGD